MVPKIELPVWIDGVYVIHLQRATARRPQVEKLQALFDRPVEAFSAIDAKALSDTDKDAAYQRSLHKPRYPFTLLDNEIACFFSHRAVWQHMVEAGQTCVLVIEDDVDIDSTIFASMLETLGDTLADGSYVRLPKKKPGYAQNDISPTLAKPALPGTGMQAQIVTKGAAQELLRVTERFDRPVDTTIQMTWLHTTQMIEIWPNGISEIDFKLGGTTIQKKKKSIFDIAKRELLRPLYKLSVELKARTHARSHSP